MGNVIALADYKVKKQYNSYNLENLDLAFISQIHRTYEKTVPTKEETDREMQLAYMKLLTKNIEEGI